MVTYCLLFFLAITTDIKKDLWVRNVLEVKKEIELRTRKTEKRIIIMSGSNSLFGINSKEIEDLIQIKTINLATHVYFPFAEMVNQLEKVVKEGDIIVLPLEITLYTRSEDDDDSRWLMKTVFHWYQDYYYQLPFIKKIKFMSKVPMDILYKTIKLRFFDKDRQVIKEKFKSSEYLFKNASAIWSGKKALKLTGKEFAYSYYSLNSRGDFTWNTKDRAEKPEDDDYHYLSLEISDNFINQYERLKSLAEKYHLQLLFTWPVALKNPLFDISRKVDKKRVMQFKKRLKDIGLDIQGELSDVQYDSEYFFDTSKHLNQDGVKLRTAVLKNIILDNIQNKDK